MSRCCESKSRPEVRRASVVPDRDRRLTAAAVVATDLLIGVAGLVRLFSLILLLAGPFVQPVRAGQPGALAALEATVADAYPDLAHLAPAALAEILARNPGGVLLIDVREEAEWRVSRLGGALRVSPMVRSAVFMRERADVVADKTVVFYCSVGVRSSKLAGRLQAALKAAGATAVYNLSGGIFRWHNEARALVDGQGATDFVHPYDAYWGRYVVRREFIRGTPEADDRS